MKQHRHVRHRDTAVFPRAAYSATWFVPPPHPTPPRLHVRSIPHHLGVNQMQVSNILQCSRCTQQSEYINFLQTLLFDYPVGNITTRCVLVYHRIQTRRLIEHVRDVHGYFTRKQVEIIFPSGAECISISIESSVNSFNVKFSNYESYIYLSK